MKTIKNDKDTQSVTVTEPMVSKIVKKQKKSKLRNVLCSGDADKYWSLTDEIFLSYLGTENSLELSNEDRNLVLVLYRQLDKYFYRQMLKQEKWESDYKKTHPEEVVKVS